MSYDPASAPMRVTPRPKAGLLGFGLYLIVFYGVWTLTGVQYKHISDSASTLFRWYVLPLACGGMVLAAVVTRFGWWRPALFDSNRTPVWTSITSVLTALIAAAMLITNDYSHKTTAMVLLTLAGSVLVGFGEEMAARGVLLTGFRQAMSERHVWFFTCACFGLMHLPNWIFGAGPGAAAQVFLTFFSGSTFYLMRRCTGTLFASMALHGLWDLAVFIGGSTALGAVGIAVNIASVVIAFVVTNPSRPQPVAPVV